MNPDGIDCPDPSHRKFRKAVKCHGKMVENYSCLFDVIFNKYEESCSEAPDFVRQGHQYVYKGGRDSAVCSDNRFQPINFWSNESSQCIYLKDTCKELGQIVFNDGSTESDRSCRCDYSKGYSFIREPQHRCYCIPSQEDCTCIVKLCSTHEVLSPDYKCIQKNLSRNEFYCDHLEEAIGISTTTEIIKMLEKDENMAQRNSNRIVANYILTALTAVSVVAAVIVWIIGTLQLLYSRKERYDHNRCIYRFFLSEQLETDIMMFDNLNIIHIHRDFLVEEMDTDTMMSALKISVEGDRFKKAKTICSYSEKEFNNINNIGTFLEILKKEKMNYIFQRLHTTQQIFSCTADVFLLSEYILKIKPWILSSLSEGGEQYLEELTVQLQNRNVRIFDNDNDRPSNYDISQLIDKIRQKGRFEMLTLVDALCIINQNNIIRTENSSFALKVHEKLDIIHKILIKFGFFNAEVNLPASVL